jgi:hypothetical protein
MTPHSDTEKRVKSLTTKAAACPNDLRDESDDHNLDTLPPTKENEKHAKGRNGNPKPKNKRKKKEKTHPLKQFYKGSTCASFHIMINIFVLIQTSSFGG